MATLNILAMGITSFSYQISGGDWATYQYRLYFMRTGQSPMFLWQFGDNQGNHASAFLEILRPSTSYNFHLYRSLKNQNNWSVISEVNNQVTLNRTEPSTALYVDAFNAYSPIIQNQFVFENGVYRGEANSCVANSLSLAMDIMANTNRSGNPTNNHFSPSYIYGNRILQSSLNSESSGMLFNETFQQINQYGTPTWSHIPQNDNGFKTFPDNRFLTSNYSGAGEGAKPMFDGRSNTLDTQAKVNKMSNPIPYTYTLGGVSYSIYFSSFYDGETLANRVQTHGWALIGIYLANNFYNIPSSGIVPQPDSLANTIGHALIVRGWITLNSVKYWICQNSWGTSWGDDGICYLPMDWGASSTANIITNGYMWNWAHECLTATYVQPSLPSIPSAPVGNNIYNSQPRIDGGVALTWTAGANNDTFDLRYRIGTGAYTQLSNLNRSTRVVTSLSYGTSYGWSVRGKNYRGDSAWSGENTLTTSPKTPTITSSSLDIGNNQVSITIGGMEGNYSFFRIWYRNVTDSGAWNYIQVNTVGSHWVTGLLDDKEYEFKVSSFITVSGTDIESRDSAGNIGYSSSVFYTLSSRPDNWAWSYNIASGQNVYSVVNKTINIMLATEWSNFTTRINQFRAYKSLANYSFTTISSGNNVTKEIINEALNAIRAMSAHFTGGNTLISNRIAGQNILEANIYINMRNCLNSIL